MQLRDDIKFQISGMKLLALYINQQCGLFNGVTKYRDDVMNCCDQVCACMDVILFGSVEHKAMVLLRTHMTESNAFLVLVLCKRVHAQILRRVFEPVVGRVSRRPSAVVLLNATVLLLNRWYQLQPAAHRASFSEDMEPLVRWLETIRSEIRLADGPPNEFYEKFGAEFRTTAIR